MSFSLADLEKRVAERALASPDESWTAKLLAAGPARVAKKFGEEAVEFTIAVTQGDPKQMTAEAADVLYHMLVALRAHGVPLAEVMGELESRTSRSGLAEKASRPGS